MTILLSFPLTLIMSIGLLGLTVYAGKTTEPNRALGIKTKATLAGREAWIAGHRAARPWILVAGLSLISVSLTAQAMYLVGAVDETTGEYLSISGIFAAFLILIISTVIAHRSAKKI